MCDVRPEALTGAKLHASEAPALAGEEVHASVAEAPPALVSERGYIS